MTDLVPGRWDLTQVFPDDETAIGHAAGLEREATVLAHDAGVLLERGELEPFLERFGGLDEAVDAAVDYARMRQYEDAAGDGVQEAVMAILGATTRARAALERALDAWRQLDADRADLLLSALASSAGSHRILRVRELATRRLAPEIEAAWAARNETARDRWANLYELVEAQVSVRFDDGTGERDWGLGDLGAVLRRSDRQVRARAYRALADGWGGARDVVALAWDAVVVDRIAEDRLRGRAHPAEETLELEELTVEAFTSLVDIVPQAYGLRQGLLRRQATLLGIDDFTVADADAPVAGMPPLSYGEVVALARAGLGSLHPQLGLDTDELVALGRIDGETRAGKQQYAVTHATRLDPPAFLSFRFTGDAANVPLLGHELGHAVALARSRAAQPPIARGWPGVLFEVPSLMGEIAAGDAFAEGYPDIESSIRLVCAQDLGWSVFESVAFCLTELDLYAARTRGDVLGGELVQECFRRRFAELYGPDVPFGEVDGLVALGAWANYTVGSRFYNFQYAVGALVALALQPLRRQDPVAFGEAYLAFLGAGRSASTSAQLAPFGLELGEATWRAGLTELERRFSLV